MNVNGPGNGVRAAYALPPVARPASARPEVEVVTRPAPATPADAGAAPAGSDPALWAILTSEERAFFVRQAALGPLSYGPGRPTDQREAAPLGQRLDVRA